MIYDVVGIGLAFNDIIASVPHSLVREYGIPLGGGGGLPLETMARLRRQLADIEYRPGGSVGNSVAGVAALGGKAGFFGKVAADEDGAAFLDDFRRRGVDVLGAPVCADAALSALCIVLVTPDRERSMPTHRGCADQFTAAEFEAFDFGASKYLLIQGEAFSSAVALPALRVAIDRARQAGCKIVVTLSMIHMWHVDAEIIRGLIATHSDILIGDSGEVAYFRTLAAAPQGPAQLLVTTRGVEGAVAEYAGQVTEVPARKVNNLVNTLGAGDQFLAGLLFGLARGWDIRDSMILGTRCAAEILRQVGPRSEIGQSWAGLARR